MVFSGICGVIVTPCGNISMMLNKSIFIIDGSHRVIFTLDDRITFSQNWACCFYVKTDKKMTRSSD